MIKKSTIDNSSSNSFTDEICEMYTNPVPHVNA